MLFLKMRKTHKKIKSMQNFWVNYMTKESLILMEKSETQKFKNYLIDLIII